MKTIDRIKVVSVAALILFGIQGMVAQGHYRDAIALSEKFNWFESLQMSPDGEHCAVRIAYEQNQDTLVVFGTGSSKALRKKAVLGQYYFLGSGMMLLPPTGGKAELWDMKRHRSLYFENASEVKAMEKDGMFVIRYGEEKQDRLELYGRNGNVLGSVDHVIQYNMLSEGRVAVVSKGESDAVSNIFLLDRKGVVPVHATTNSIQYVIPGYQDSELLVFERDLRGLPFLYCLSEGKQYVLSDIMQVAFDAAYVQKTAVKGTYFLKLWSKEEKAEEIVDIWYTNDRDLENKYEHRGTERYYLWEPQKKVVRELAGDKGYTVLNTGSTRNVLAFDRFQFNNYIANVPDIELSVCQADTCRPIDTFSPEIYVSGKGNYVLAPQEGEWALYDLATGKQTTFGNQSLKVPFFTEDETTIYFGGDGGLWSYQIKKSVLSKLIAKEGLTVSIVNGESTWLTNYNFYQNTVGTQNGLLLKLTEDRAKVTSYAKYHNGKLKVLVAPTGNLVTGIKYDAQLKDIAYLEQNFNLPPRLVHKIENKSQRVYCNDWQDAGAGHLQREIVQYPDSKGNMIEGTLFYPAGYDPNQSYPMVVYIYQLQRYRKHTYLSLSFRDPEGFNTRALIENGYFVFFPDITEGNDGAGFGALQCVNNALDALGSVSAINRQKIGLIGHSFGGYETNFIATQSKHFSAYVSGCGNIDIIHNYHSFNINFVRPSYWRYETHQFYMNGAFTENKEVYYKNNPLYEVDKITTPILLWTGLEDENVKWEETRTFYNALRRNGKKAIALFYPGEGHALVNPKANRDLSIRILEWFDFHLKGKQDIEWIRKEMEKGA
ncbi:prolyl oligopeptidase family serine peptidase [Flavobacterium sp.]|uniref:alpha/beta hydrolase family protein n=1 Tax=Flavobacterium sp. TaxID=239 RepID=UPI002618C504|nr:prolyl oligopeptidase family serine peptidase [Flavobacterium sp.]